MTRLAAQNGNSEIVADIYSPEYAKAFAKRMLKTQVFTGTFVEKRFVESLNSYRDVITIDEEETEFIENLLAVKNKIETNIVKKPWIGITLPETVGAPVGHNLWVTLPQEIFGKYWFKVKTVEFSDTEIKLKLTILRPFKKEKTPTKEPTEVSNFDISEVSGNLKQNLIYFWREVLTFSNIKQSVIFISLLMSTMIIALVDITKYLLEYILKLIRELSGFVKAATPFMTTVVNMVGRVIYLFFMMIVNLWHGKKSATPPQLIHNYYVDPSSKGIGFRDPRERYNQYFSQRALPYRSGVTITELDDH